MMNLKSIARALGGEVSRQQVLAPGPGHSKHDRSMAVFLDTHNPDGFRVHSFSGDSWQLCRDHVKQRLGIPGEPSRTFEPRIVEAKPERDDRDRTLYAMRIWGEARDLNGTVALTYLVSRGIDLGRLPPLRHALRWHPACPWEGGKHGAMIGLLTDAITGEPRAIHRTALTPQGQKIDRKMLGPAGGCVVRLWPDEMVTQGLVLGEGIETTLSAATRLDHNGRSLTPAWAACSAGNLAKFPVLAGIGALTLLVDNDKSGTGQRAALECADRWTSGGKEVTTLMPSNEGEDFADVTIQIVRGAA
jgi:putative DNA primase/helicase